MLTCAGTREEGRQVCAERAVNRGAGEDAGRAVRPGRRAAQLGVHHTLYLSFFVFEPLEPNPTLNPHAFGKGNIDSGRHGG